ncbi:sugar phosphate isomerase/epimerase [Streptomycetaceae bacterium NBC_01309]
MPLTASRFALNPLQWLATDDGWPDFGAAPPLAERLAVIAKAGFTAIQAEVPKDSDPARYRAELAEYGIAPGPGYVNLPWDDDAAERAAHLGQVRRLAREAVALGNPLLFLAMGMSPDAPRIARPAVGFGADPAFLSAVRDYLAEAAAAITAEGGVAALHPHVGSWVETEAETRYVLDSVDPAVLKFGADAGHLAWTGADPARVIGDYADRVAGIHVKDLHHGVARRSREEGLTYQQSVAAGLWTEPGFGDADLPGVLAALGNDFDGWVVVEVDRGSVPPAESVARCGAWLARTVGGAQQGS